MNSLLDGEEEEGSVLSLRLFYDKRNGVAVITRLSPKGLMSVEGLMKGLGVRRAVSVRRRSLTCFAPAGSTSK